jgi:hypothetical protein
LLRLLLHCASPMQQKKERISDPLIGSAILSFLPRIPAAL